MRVLKKLISRKMERIFLSNSGSSSLVKSAFTWRTMPVVSRPRLTYKMRAEETPKYSRRPRTLYSRFPNPSAVKRACSLLVCPEKSLTASLDASVAGQTSICTIPFTFACKIYSNTKTMPAVKSCHRGSLFLKVK